MTLRRTIFRVGATPEHRARADLLRFASQILYTRAGWTWADVLEHGLIHLEERLRVDAAARGYPLDKLYRDAGELAARRRRTDRGECEPRKMGSGVYPPDAVPERTRGGGYHSQGVRAVVDEGGIL